MTKAQAKLNRAILGQRRQAMMRAAARQQLEKLARVEGGGRMSRGYFPGRGPTSGAPSGPKPMRPGEFDVQYGMAPTEADVTRFMQATGTAPNPNAMLDAMQTQQRRQQLAQRRAAAQAQAAATPAPPSALDAFVAQQQAEAERARQENLKRYDEGHGELTDLRQRNQARVGNWGVAAQQDIDERLSETESRLRADAASRGLANSNVPGAIIQRAARDTAREQQRVSEMRDDRLARYDTTDTGNLVGFVERRNDIGPDPNLTAQVALQLGQQGLAEKELEYQQKRDMLQLALAERQRRDALRLGAAGLAQRGGSRSGGGVPIFVGPEATGIPGWATSGLPIVTGNVNAPLRRRKRPDRLTVAEKKLANTVVRRSGKGPKILSKPPLPASLRQRRLGVIEQPMYA